MAALLRYFANLCIVLLQGFEDAAYGPFDRAVVHQAVAYIDKGKVDAASVGERVVLVVEAEGLACAPAHQHAVYGVVEALFWHGNEERHRGVGAAGVVASRHGTQRVGKT